MSEDLIQRYEAWLSKGYVPNPYFQDQAKWEQEIRAKIFEIKNKK